MKDIFYLELQKANNALTSILNGDDPKRKLKAIDTVEESIDMFQILSIVMTEDSFLDAEIKVSDFEKTPGFKDFKMVFDLYIEFVEIKGMGCGGEIDDEHLLELFMLKTIFSERPPEMQLSLLIFVMGFMSLKNRETLLFRHEKFMAVIPNQISSHYLKNARFAAIKDFEIERIGDRLLTLSCGNTIAVPQGAEGFNLVTFIDETLQEMTIGEVKKLVSQASDDDLLNVMSVISGAGRKKILDNADYENAAWISRRVNVFSIFADAVRGKIFSKDEVWGDYRNRILPSVRRMIEIMITITGKRLKYTRRKDNERNQKRIKETVKRTEKD